MIAANDKKSAFFIIVIYVINKLFYMQKSDVKNVRHDRVKITPQ